MGIINFGFEIIHCGVEGCNFPFAMESGTVDSRRIDGRWFYCPNGHKIRFTPGDSAPVKKVKQELDACRMEGQKAAAQARHEAALRRTAEKRLNAARDGHVFQEWGKWKGLCPKCYKEQPRGSKARRNAEAWVRRHDDEEHKPVVPRKAVEQEDS